MQKNIGGAFPATCVLDDFNRPDGEPGLNWLIQNDGDYFDPQPSARHAGAGDAGRRRPAGTTLWSAPLGAARRFS